MIWRVFQFAPHFISAYNQFCAIGQRPSFKVFVPANATLIVCGASICHINQAFITMSARSKIEFKTVIILAALFIAAWLLWDTPVVYPIKIFVVCLHELGHAVAALLTGGQVMSIQIFPEEGGVTFTRGGWPFVILSAGYLGSMLAGSVLLYLSNHQRRGRGLMLALAALIAMSTLLFFRNLFGVIYPGRSRDVLQRAALARGRESHHRALHRHHQLPVRRAGYSQRFVHARARWIRLCQRRRGPEPPYRPAGDHLGHAVVGGFAAGARLLAQVFTPR